MDFLGIDLKWGGCICDHNVTAVVFVQPHQGPRRLLTFLKDTEWSIIAGLILSVIFSLLVVCGIFLALRCSGRRRLRRRMMLRHKTMDRDDAGLTRDRIQYTIITTQQDDFDDQDSDDMA